MISDRYILEHCGLSQVSNEFCVSTSDAFESLLNDILSNLHTPLSHDRLAPLFLLAGLHQVPGSWQSPNTINISDKLFQRLYQQCEVTNLTDFLTASTQERCPLILAIFRPIQLLFSSSDWSSSPTARLLAVWIQDQLAYPTLGLYLHLFFPVLLKLLDDPIPCNKVLGLKSCIRMTENVSQADLLIHNRAQVLLTAVESFLFSNHPDVLSNLQPLASRLLSVIEQPPSKGASPHILGLTLHDMYMEKLLQTVSTSSPMEMKRVRIKILLECIALFESALYPHLSKVVEIAVSYLELPDRSAEETRFVTLDLIIAICQCCSQRIQHYLFQISLALLKVLTQCSQSKLDATPKSSLYRQLSLKVVECCVRLYECDECSGKLLRYLRAVTQVKEGSAFVRNALCDVIKRVSVEKSD